MKTSHRPFIFESNDFESMCRFVIENCGHRKDRFLWHIGRLVDWKYNLINSRKCIPDNFSRETELWFDWFGELIGFVLTEDFGSELSFFMKPEWFCLQPEMVRWAKSHWGSRHDRLSIMVIEGSNDFIAVLESEGFSRTDGLERTHIFDTARYADYALPDLSVRFEDMTVHGDYEAHDAIRTDAWPKSQPPEQLREIRSYTRRSPIYEPKFDFVLVLGDGRAVSSCEAFVDRQNGTAEIERVCTLRTEWGRHYARMTLLSCLRRLHESGVPMAFLTGGYDKTLHLYGNLGHTDAFDLHTYEWTC